MVDDGQYLEALAGAPFHHIGVDLRHAAVKPPAVIGQQFDLEHHTQLHIANRGRHHRERLARRLKFAIVLFEQQGD